MLVLDIADDHLDDVLHRHQPMRAAIFVDDKREMGVRRLHLHQQIERRHGGRHIEHRLQRGGGGERRRKIDRGQRAGRRMLARRRVGRSRRHRLGAFGERGEIIDEVADVDHAARIVQRVAIDGQARMAALHDLRVADAMISRAHIVAVAQDATLGETSRAVPQRRPFAPARLWRHAGRSARA